MSISHEQRDSAYRATSGKTRELYDGDATGEAVRTIFESYHLPQKQYREFALAFGDVILGLSLKENLAQTLATQAGVSEKIAPLIAKELIVFLELELGRARVSNSVPASAVANLDRGTATAEPPQSTHAEAPANSPIPPAGPATQAQSPTATPIWNTAPKSSVPPVEPTAPEDKPFYPRVPNYSKPFTTPSAPPAPSAVPPRPVTLPSAAQPRANDPYHEQI